MKEEIERILRNRFTRGDIQTATNELLDLFNVSHSSDSDEEIIEDGFGSAWTKKCAECGRMSMQVVRPGKAQCSYCG